MFKEGQEVWVAFKDSSNKYKATVIATGEHFTCVHSWVGIPNMEKKEIIENERVFALDYDKVKTIRIGEYDVPEPIRNLPNLGKAGVSETVWIPALNENLCFALGVGNSYTRWYLENNLCHWTKEAAILHTKALLFFTTTELSHD